MFISYKFVNLRKPFNMRSIKLLLLTVALFAASAIHAARTDAPDFYTRWMDVPSRKLIDMAMDYVLKKNKPDSALVCLSIVGNRYKPSLSYADKEVIIGSFNGKWYVYFFCYFDYTKSYESLKRALELCDECHHSKSRVYLNFGCMYQTMSEQSHDRKLDEKAFSYYRKAFYEARKINNNDILFDSFGNMVSVAYSLSWMDKLQKEWQYVSRILKKDKHSSHVYMGLMYRSMCMMRDRHYDEAITMYRKQLDVLGENTNNIRYRCVAYINLSKAYQAKGDYRNAVVYAKEAEHLSNQYDMKDAKLETYSMLAECYEQLNMNEQTEAYRNRYFRIKDTLLNYHQLASVNEMQFLDKMKAIDDQMTAIKHRSQIKSIIATVALLFALVIVVFFIVVFRKNKKLRATNESLYKKNVEMLKAEEKERQERREKERLMAEIKPEKYKSSPLQNNSKSDLVSRIISVFENTDVICSVDFSAIKLAELTESKYNYVSQVINENFGCNFNAVLNEYRIKEACNRMNDISNYGNYTIEAIANSVGYSSTNSFRAAFRKSTGLSPSEYQKIARDKNQKG